MADHRGIGMSSALGGNTRASTVGVNLDAVVEFSRFSFDQFEIRDTDSEVGRAILYTSCMGYGGKSCRSSSFLSWRQGKTEEKIDTSSRRGESSHVLLDQSTSCAIYSPCSLQIMRFFLKD